MGHLSTHVLDTAHGRPAEGMAFSLSRLSGDGGRTVVLRAETNRDGRTEAALIEGVLETGIHELTFEVAAYFRRQGVTLPEPPFLDVVTLRFGIADPDGHYHVPLLVSPYGYTTYRGS
jgi:5-hydroxyisourate hydrolase